MHPFAPVYTKQSKTLILGSFPSVKSRESSFYYGHPQNRFWRVVAMLFGESIPDSIEKKTALLQHYHIALWDVVASCKITGSADSSLKAKGINDIASLLRKADYSKCVCQREKSRKFVPVLSGKGIKYPYPNPAIHKPRQCCLVIGAFTGSMESD